MLIRDKVYGAVEVASPIMVELIGSRPMQRLKRISQYGIPDAFFYRKGFSRYEHSVGVMLLLKKLGATEEEQIAGLLHDVSHTAFSHVIDWVIGEGGAEAYQDEQHERFVLESEIPGILTKYGYRVERIIDYHHFGLLERDSPDLCADRIDYALREFPHAVARRCTKALTVAEGRIVFASKEAATLFARYFLKHQVEHWGGFEGVARYRVFADILRLALQDGTITMDDFWQDDDFVMAKLQASPNVQVRRMLDLLEHAQMTDQPQGAAAVYKKFRHVDPHFIENNTLARLKDTSPDFARELEEARRLNQRGLMVPTLAELTARPV